MGTLIWFKDGVEFLIDSLLGVSVFFLYGFNGILEKDLVLVYLLMIQIVVQMWNLIVELVVFFY